MFIHFFILIAIIRNTILRLMGQLQHLHHHQSEPGLPMQNPPARITPIPPPPPLYADWARHADDGELVYFLRPAYPNHTPLELWPGEIAEVAKWQSLPAEHHRPQGYRWYPSTRDQFWWGRMYWEIQYGRKWIMEMNPFDHWDKAQDRTKPCRVRNNTI